MLCNIRKFISLFNKRSTSPKCMALLGSSKQSCRMYTQLSECDGVREICLNEPKTHNALSLAMLEELSQHLCLDWHDKTLRCIVISSTGPIWSAGHDLKELSSEKGADQQERIFKKLIEVIKSIHQAPVPVIAKVNGLVAAGGVQLVSSCDIIVCSNSSAFVTPSANIGVFACTPTVPMSRLMSHNKCLDMLFTGHPLTAEDAIKHGLVSRVVPESDLDEEMDTIIKSIKKKSRSVLALGKTFFYKQLELPLEVAYDEAVNKMIENLRMNDSKEGIKSFLEKRAPNWSHL